MQCILCSLKKQYSVDNSVCKKKKFRIIVELKQCVPVEKCLPVQYQKILFLHAFIHHRFQFIVIILFIFSSSPLKKCVCTIFWRAKHERRDYKRFLLIKKKNKIKSNVRLRATMKKPCNNIENETKRKNCAKINPSYQIFKD